MRIKYTPNSILRGLLIYSSGDTVASIITNSFSLTRMFGMMIIGATIYAIEIPNYFDWIERRVKSTEGWIPLFKRTLLALLYFNPLWISRHLLFINILSNYLHNIKINLLYIGLTSFVVNIPISFIANYYIQNKIKLKNRFLASAVFSALMAVYYALSEILFK